MKNIFQKIILLTIVLSPSISLAADSCSSTSMDNVSGILTWLGCLLVKQVLPLLMALGVVGFIFGIIKFFLNPNNEKEKEGGKKFMTNGLIALFVMVSFWGILKIVINTFSLNNETISLPSLDSWYENK